MVTKIATVDMHTGGEPVRIVIGGAPESVGQTVLERRRWFAKRADWVRQALMGEPRGHADMYGCYIVPPERQDSDFGAIFMHNEGYSTMCGHATLALARFAVEEGLAQNAGEIKIDVPCGQVIAQAHFENGAYRNSSFRNIGSFVLERDRHVEVEGLGAVEYDVVFGGAFYAIVDATRHSLSLEPEGMLTLIQLGRKIKLAVQCKGEPQHPFEPDLNFLYGVIFVGPPQDPRNHSRNVCVFADGEIDRSPTGSGISGRIALHVARGEVALGEEITIESIIGSTMTVCAVEEAEVGRHIGVAPEIGGTSYYTGRSEFVFEDEDPLRDGFFVR